VSGYQYHLRATEAWVLAPRAELGGASWQSFFKSVSTADGVRSECLRTLPELREAAKVFHATSAVEQVLSIRFEAFASNFSSTMRAVFNFVSPVLRARLPRAAAPDPARLVDAVSPFDLATHAPKPSKASHVSSIADKEALRSHLVGHARLRYVLLALSEVLGYLPSQEFGAASTTVFNAERVFNEVDQIVNAFWRDEEQSPSKIGGAGWHFPDL